MRRASIAFAALLLALSAGCSEPAPRIDPSTPETTAASLQVVQNSLSEERRQEFSRALAVVIPHAMGGGYKEVGDTAETRARVQEALRDKTADEIIADAARIRKASAAPQP